MSGDTLWFTLKELHENTVDIMRQIQESNQRAVITYHGRFVAVIMPLPDSIESRIISAYLEGNPIPEPENVYSSQEVLEHLNNNPLPIPDKKGLNMVNSP